MGKDDIFEELKAIAGPEIAKRLFDHYSGSNVYFSKGSIIRQKHREIREEFRNGASYRELGFKYGYGERYIRRIIHRKERKDGQ
jgi:Mor family transcriptional regulator